MGEQGLSAAADNPGGSARPALQVQQHGPVRVLVNDNAAARNALTPAYYDAMLRELRAAPMNAGTGALVLTGAGGYFCSGGDLRQLQKRRDLPAAQRRKNVEGLNDLIRAVRECPLPVIAAVEGGAAGAGVSLALACDLLIMASNARLSIAYVKVGLSPDGGVTAMLAQCLPRQLLAELCLTGDAIEAARLAHFGLVNRLVEPGSALTQAIELAARLSAGPARSMSRIKSLTHSAFDVTFSTQLDEEASRMVDSLGDDEGAEGIAAFLGKRRPDYAALRGK